MTDEKALNSGGFLIYMEQEVNWTKKAKKGHISPFIWMKIWVEIFSPFNYSPTFVGFFVCGRMGRFVYKVGV